MRLLAFLGLAVLSHIASAQPKHCDIYRDDNGVFHTRGTDELAAYACMGFLHGRERAFQVDYFRRVAQGRMAELLGTGSIKNDFFMRLMGLGERGRQLAATLPPGEQKALAAYSEGMTLGLKAAVKEGVYEFKQLGYEPEPWQPSDSMSILLLQSFAETQASFWQKMKEEKRRELLGPKAEALYQRDGLPWDVSILKSGEFIAQTAAETGPRRAPGFDTREGSREFAKPPVPWREGTGSNSWVLSPKWTASGKAWLANDPHLELTHPPFWFWIHLSGGALDAIGATVPGVPIIPSGLNRHVAWGLTDSYIEVGDIVAIPEAETKELASERPTIWVKMGFMKLPFVFKTFQRTKEGWPILPLDAPPGRSLVLRWTGLLVKGSGLAGMSRLMNAESVKEVDGFFSTFELPTWNYVFADTHGDIGYRAEGLMPRQDAPPPFGVRDGLSRDLSTWPLATAEESPHVMNPSRGYIVTANNRQVPAGARFYHGRAYPLGFRGFRIEELLSASHSNDLESLARIQCDTQAVDARFLVPKLLAFAAARNNWSEREKRALAALKSWDFSTGPECTACAIYVRWTDRISEAKAMDVGALYRALDEPAAYADTIAASLHAALNDIRADGTERHPFPAWKDMHRAFFRHLSKAPAFETRDSMATPSDEFSVNPAKAEWINGAYRQTHGASQRLIVELTDPPTAWFALAGPNRDVEKRDFTSPDSPWVRWRDCRYAKVKFPLDWSTVKAESVDF